MCIDTLIISLTTDSFLSHGLCLRLLHIVQIQTLIHHSGVKGHSIFLWHLGTCHDVTGFPLAQWSLARLTADLCRWCFFRRQPATLTYMAPAVTHCSPEIVTWLHYGIASFGHTLFVLLKDYITLMERAKRVSVYRMGLPLFSDQ